MTSARRIRVLVVDDSAFARKVIREVLEVHARIDVVGIARDGIDALEKIAELKPDVITLDLVMPQLDGLGVLDAIRSLPDAPRVVVVTMSDADSSLGIASLLAGAYDVVHKPTALATDRLYELGEELVHKILSAAEAAAGENALPLRGGTPLPGLDAHATLTTKMVVVGASTGGPRAITQLLRALPQTFPAPVAVVVHMPTGYTEAFASRLDRECPLEVVEAKAGTVLRAGLVVVARAGIHMKVCKVQDEWLVVLDVEPMDALHRPSVDALFKSAAHEVGCDVLGVVLTGMGNDGLEGARAIRAAGGRVIVEAESTCVVYGMPRVIAEAGLADATIPLPEIAAGIIARL